MLRTLTQHLPAGEGKTCRPFGPRILLLKRLPRPDGRGYYIPALRASCTPLSICINCLKNH